MHISVHLEFSNRVTELQSTLQCVANSKTTWWISENMALSLAAVHKENPVVPLDLQVSLVRLLYGSMYDLYFLIKSSEQARESLENSSLYTFHAFGAHE